MLKIVKYAIITNVLLALLFIYSSYTLWNSVNAEYPYLIASHWSPLGISAPHYAINSNGSIAIVQTVYLYWNTPFWIFWLLMAVNLCFMLIIGREVKEAKPLQ